MPSQHGRQASSRDATGREKWVREGLRALAAGGPDAVRVEALAQALGVTKGGFYWHFADRPALLGELLDAWERMSIDDVVERIEREGGDARAQLAHLFALAAADDRLLPIDLAVRDWARRDAAVAERLRRVDDRRMDYMRSLFVEMTADRDEAEARAFTAFCLFVAPHFIAAEHGPRSRAQVLELAARRLLA